LILVQSLEALFEPSNACNCVSPYKRSSGSHYLISQKHWHEPRRFHQLAGCDGEVGDVVSTLVLLAPGPARPVFCCAIHHRRRRQTLHYRHLLLELLRQPDIIGVEKGNVLTAASAYPEVARRAHPAVSRSLVSEQRDAPRELSSPTKCDLRTRVG